MCNVIFTDKKLPCKLLQRQLFIEMVINIINNVLIKILFLFLALWILLFVDNTVQLKNKIIHTEGNLCLFSKTLRLNLLDQLENPILDRGGAVSFKIWRYGADTSGDQAHGDGAWK